ncbi:MAG: helix-turn-helix transcriptional regulator [Lachnospiraceae bacterium]|jgi:AraC-like DNA-binding protein|nr:helix-turn-helix transcriptional regulator [Lachnospiraceae bacterium]MCI9095332.1 helix-turn-helix transcriptional regulator [Lachnospiraceae bacterium]
MNYSSLYENKKRGTVDFPIELYSLTSASPRYQMPFHWHLDYELILISSGSFALSLDGKAFPMQAGDCAWVGGGVIHGGIPSDCVYECVVFDLGTLLHDTPVCARSAARFLSDESEYTGVFPGGSLQAELSGRLMRAMREEQGGYEWTTLGLMWQLMGSLVSQVPSSPAPYPNRGNSPNRGNIKKMKWVLAYIRDHYEEAVTLTELARVAGMSPKYFCRAFSHMTGKTPIEYLNYYRIEQAGEQLLLTERSVTEIALACGFNDMSYFSRTFSRYKGASPTAYRKSAKSLSHGSGSQQS